MEFVFLECLNKACRFRFPVAGSEAGNARCPHCREELTVAAIAESGNPPQESTVPQGSGIVALLDNIRSIHNVGSMFRTADGAGVRHLYLCGITATPIHPKLAKAALGAQQTVGWTYYSNGIDAAHALKATGYQLWALERVAGSAHLFIDGVIPTEPIALVVGNERAGVDPGILALCDRTFSLPMAGRKSSLNAAVAFGIGVYFLRYGVEPMRGLNRAESGESDDYNR